MEKPRIFRPSCNGCHECIGICPSDAISFKEGGASIDSGKCSGCGMCLNVCRSGAILRA